MLQSHVCKTLSVYKTDFYLCLKFAVGAPLRISPAVTRQNKALTGSYLQFQGVCWAARLCVCQHNRLTFTLTSFLTVLTGTSCQR